MFAMMHLRNATFVKFLLRSAARGSAVKRFALDRNSEWRQLKIGDNWSYAPRVKNFWLRHWMRNLKIFLRRFENVSPGSLVATRLFLSKMSLSKSNSKLQVEISFGTTRVHTPPSESRATAPT